MTVLAPYKNEEEHLKELLLKNLPPKIKGGNEKNNSNIFEMPAIQALKSCQFINFNSKERISFMIFDLDTYEGENAIETFKTIDMFCHYLIKEVGMEPTFITQTKKGYHFAYHFKNHIFTHQLKPLKYLNDIKRGIIAKLKCDIHGSSRNYGIWRNPLLHNYYYSQNINYELRDFKDFAIPQTSTQQKFKRDITIRQVNQNILVKGNRNNVIFQATMVWAKHHKALNQNDIIVYASKYNNQAKEPLDPTEVHHIAKSVYRYYSQGLIYAGTKSINEGIMGFPPIKNVPSTEFYREVKLRQSEAAHRTNAIVDPIQKKENMLNAKKIHIENQKKSNIKKIKDAIQELSHTGDKINYSSIARVSGLNRKTVKKYMDNI